MTSVEGSLRADSVMSGAANPADTDPAGRRMSDPVRPLDRNFGVNGGMSRHRSFGNLQGGGGPNRVPIHNQRVRGQDAAGYMPTPQQQHVNQAGMYPGMRMYGGGGNMQGGGYYPGFQAGAGYDPAAASAAQYGQQQFPNVYNNQQQFNQQQQCDFNQFQQQQPQQQYPPNWEQQQQQSWNMDWSWNGRNQAPAATNPPPPVYNEAVDKDRRGSGAAAAPAPSDSYLRTLQYVKNCQSWANSPENPEKLKRSPPHQAMPPPAMPGVQHGHANGMQTMPNGMPQQMGGMQPGMPGMMPVKQQQDNMILGDVNSSMNALMEENRYLQMLQ